MATQEARALLDSLMGGDRNAPLPYGTAVPSRKRQRDSSGAGMLLLPGKRNKSCYDKDIDPLYTAWGVDVYDLFVNTKSDLGTNPYVVDQAAHNEFLKLPTAEKERLGYNFFLFQKLQELVRQCDRIVTRNKEKLSQELSKKLSQRGGQDFVEDVDEAAVELLARSKIKVELLSAELESLLQELEQVAQQEVAGKAKLEPLLVALKEEKKANEMAAEPTVTKKEDEPDAVDKNGAEDSEPSVEKEETKQVAVKTEKDDTPDASHCAEKDESLLEQQKLELGKLTLEKQRIIYELSRIVSRLAPLQEGVANQQRNLSYVKSDISTDKAVCEVSGNFMSSRDADERIAAHYAGKQYIGWNLVRNKFSDMMKEFGRWGPPPPGRREPPGGTGGHPHGGGYGGVDRGRGRGRFDGGGGGMQGGYRGGFQDRRGSGGGPPRGPWQRR